MPTNNFLVFATAGGANVQSQADYSASSQRTDGQQPGIASSALNNKALRQANFIAATLAQYLVNITGDDVLDDGNQTNLLATMAKIWPRTAPNIITLASTGTPTGYYFTCSAANATVGATYTNNGHTFTVLSTIAGGTRLYTSGALAPSASGTLTKATGTGDATITFSAAVAMATYTPSANVLYARVKVQGAGGGGSGSGTTAGTPATASGGDSIFGIGVILAPGGGPAGTNQGGVVGTGGAAPTINSPATKVIGVPGGSGGGGGFNSGAATTYAQAGGIGGPSYMGGSGSAGTGGSVGGVGATNTGAGGGGGAGSTTAGVCSGHGGGAGAYAEAIISAPVAEYYVVGAAGPGGSNGTSGFSGGAGAAGQIVIEEYFA